MGKKELTFFKKKGVSNKDIKIGDKDIKIGEKMTDDTVVSIDVNQVEQDGDVDQKNVKDSVDTSTDTSTPMLTQEDFDRAVASRVARESQKTKGLQQELEELRKEKEERIKAEESAELEAAEKNNEQIKANTILKEQSAKLERQLLEKDAQIDEVYKRAEQCAIKSEVCAVLGSQYSELEQVWTLMEAQGHLSNIEVQNQDFKDTFKLSINSSKVLDIAAENYSRFKKQQAPSITSSDSNVAGNVRQATAPSTGGGEGLLAQFFN